MIFTFEMCLLDQIIMISCLLVFVEKFLMINKILYMYLLLTQCLVCCPKICHQFLITQNMCMHVNERKILSLPKKMPRFFSSHKIYIFTWQNVHEYKCMYPIDEIIKFDKSRGFNETVRRVWRHQIGNKKP